MDEIIIAVKNKRTYVNDAVKIISGAFLSLLLIIVVLIFRNAIAFKTGKYSMLDFTLLFLILSGGLFINGIKALRNHRKMPNVMITNHESSFFILGNEFTFDEIKSLDGRHEFGRTGTMIIATESATFKLYGVQNYANAIKTMSSIITQSLSLREEKYKNK